MKKGAGRPAPQALRGRLRPAAASRDRTPAEPFGLGVGEIELADAFARVRKGDAHCRALTVRNLRSGLVTDADRFACQLSSSVFSRISPSLTKARRQSQAATRARRIRHERNRLSSACSSGSSSEFRARTTRKWRGRKSSIVRPSRYCSTTAGLTYEERATAAVF